MKPRGEEKDPGAWMVVKQIVGTLLDETIAGELPQRSSTRVVLASWLIFAFIVGNVYRGNLTAYLTAPKYPPRAETLADLVDTGAKITTTPNTASFIQEFKRSSSAMYRAVSERTEYVSTPLIGMQQAITEKKAFLYERLNMMTMITERFTSKKGSTPLYVARDYILPDYTGWPLTPNAPFKDNFDHYILAFHGAGLINRWTREVLQKAKFDTQRQQSNGARVNNVYLKEQDAFDLKITMALTLVHMQGPLSLYLAGVFLSLAVFISEKVIPLFH